MVDPLNFCNEPTSSVMQIIDIMGSAKEAELGMSITHPNIVRTLCCSCTENKVTYDPTWFAQQQDIANLLVHVDIYFVNLCPISCFQV